MPCSQCSNAVSANTSHSSTYAKQLCWLLQHDKLLLLHPCHNLSVSLTPCLPQSAPNTYILSFVQI
jgi:hypothetical protein